MSDAAAQGESLEKWDSSSSVEFGMQRVFPEGASPFAWSALGPVIEYALRRAFCRELALLPWPASQHVSAFVKCVDGRALLSDDLFVTAAGTARACGPRTKTRALRVRWMAEHRWAPSALSFTDALREGRSCTDIFDRTYDDLLFTLGKLRDWVFCVSEYFVSSAFAEVTGEKGRDIHEKDFACALGGFPAFLCEAPETPSQDMLDLQEHSVAGGGKGSKTLRTLSRAVRLTFREIEMLVMEIARRLADSGFFSHPADLVYLVWDELPVAVSQGIPKEGLQSTLIERRARFPLAAPSSFF